MEENFDYEKAWEVEEEEKREKLVKDLPRGYPRTGLPKKINKVWVKAR